MNSIFWTAKPYPHIVIDDFLPDLQYKAIHKLLYGVRDVDMPIMAFDNATEGKKECFASDSYMGAILQPVKDALTSETFIENLKTLIRCDKIVSLEHFKGNGNIYSYYHQHKEGGHLGSHVDHSQLYDKQHKVIEPHWIHFLNTIFYIPEFPYVRGDTLLYGRTGWGKPENYVECRDNRLLIFLHSSHSFHGVGKVWGGRRTTVYMDYYTTRPGIEDTQWTYGKHNGYDEEPPQWYKHGTTFIPNKVTGLHRYGLPYLKYLRKELL